MIREKYIKEHYPRWFIHGYIGSQVCVTDGRKDFAITDRDTAKSLCDAHNKLVDVLVNIGKDVSLEEQMWGTKELTPGD